MAIPVGGVLPSPSGHSMQRDGEKSVHTCLYDDRPSMLYNNTCYTSSTYQTDIESAEERPLASPGAAPHPRTKLLTIAPVRSPLCDKGKLDIGHRTISMQWR